jgi:hypothetical protein
MDRSKRTKLYHWWWMTGPTCTSWDIESTAWWVMTRVPTPKCIGWKGKQQQAKSYEHARTCRCRSQVSSREASKLARPRPRVRSQVSSRDARTCWALLWKKRLSYDAHASASSNHTYHHVHFNCFWSNEQCFSLVINQYKHQHKLNFSIS